MVNFIPLLAPLAALVQTPLAAFGSTPTSSPISMTSAISTAPAIPTDPVYALAIPEQIAVLQVRHDNLTQRVKQVQQADRECVKDDFTMWDLYYGFHKACQSNKDLNLAEYYMTRRDSAQVAWLNVFQQCVRLKHSAKTLAEEQEKLGKKLEELKELK